MTMGEQDPYLKTVDRIEPDITMLDTGAALASIAISLKRIADHLDRLAAPPKIMSDLAIAEYQRQMDT